MNDSKMKVLEKYGITGELAELSCNKIIDCEEIAHDRNAILKRIIEVAKKECGITPSLAIYKIKSVEPNSHIENILAVAKEIGVNVVLKEFHEDVLEEVIIDSIKESNKDEDISGILVNLPLSESINEINVLSAIADSKDVNCMSPMARGLRSLGCWTAGVNSYYARAIVEIFGYLGIDITGKKAVVLGRSIDIAQPIADTLDEFDAFVTCCHSNTPYNQLVEELRKADIVVSATNIPDYIKRGMLGFNQIVIDVGSAVNEDGEVCGDVKLQDAIVYASYITPSSKEVESVAISCLMENVMECGLQYIMPAIIEKL